MSLEVSLEVGGVQRVLTNLGPPSPDISCPLEVSLEVGEVQRVLSIHVLTLRGSAVLWLLTLSVACSLNTTGSSSIIQHVFICRPLQVIMNYHMCIIIYI